MDITKECSRDIIDILHTTEMEKIKYAEFGTPFILRQDMLNLLPKSFWKNRHVKVLEPTCGKGGFVVDIIQRFMEGLKSQFYDSAHCYKHILENIVYFADINGRNVKKLAKLLDSNCNFKLNYHIGDTLKDDILKTFKIKGFHLVAGNPPYNPSGAVATGKTIYQDFIEIALNKWILPKGYLLFVTPSAWRKPVNEKSVNKGLWELMTQQNWLKYLEIHDAKDGRKMFNASTRYDFYLIQKAKPKKSTIVDQKGKKQSVNLDSWPWLPNYDLKFIKKLLAKKGEKTVDILFNTNYSSQKPHVKKSWTPFHRFVCIHSTPKAGPIHKYSSSKNYGHFNIPKVIFGDSGPATAIANKKGEFCMTEHAMAIVDKTKNLSNILKAIQSQQFKEILPALLWSPFQIDWRMFMYFRDDFWEEFL